MSWSKKVHVIAPAFPLEGDLQIQDFQKGLKVLEKWGYQTLVPEKLFGPDLLCANTDKMRFQHLKKALQSSTADLIWCVRGGYGSVRLLPWLAEMEKPEKPKRIVGISDVTSLHSFVNNVWGWKSLHFPLIDRLGSGVLSEENEQEIFDYLQGRLSHIEYPLVAMNSAAKKKGTLSATLVGGNLTVLTGSLGTPYLPYPKKKKYFLFLEDLGERGYRVDRMLQQWVQSGALHQCQGILLGEFLGGHEPLTSQNPEAFLAMPVLQRFADEISIPVFAGVPAGHGKTQRPVIFGDKILITAGKAPKVRFSGDK
jgi:muramoyltetrapeptide carboxypeptidase